MGEVVSYTKDGIDEFIFNAEIVGTDLVLTRGTGETIVVPLPEGITQEDVDAAIAELVDSAPGTLDTLNEIAAALQDDPNVLTALKSGSMGVVIHGATASVSRPAGYGAIHWIGSVTPTNAIDNDVWTDTSA